jgi:hypothetical protein
MRYDREIAKLRDNKPKYVPLPYRLLRYENSLRAEIRKQQRNKAGGKAKGKRAGGKGKGKPKRKGT